MLTQFGLELAANTLYTAQPLKILLCNGNWTLASQPNSAVVLNSALPNETTVTPSTVNVSYNVLNNGMDVIISGIYTPISTALINRLAIIRGTYFTANIIANSTNTITLAPSHGILVGDRIALVNNQYLQVTAVVSDVITLDGDIVGVVTGIGRVVRGDLIGLYIPDDVGQLVAGREIAVNLNALSLNLPA